MDLSKLPDSQRQELEQLQKQFHEHQHQQQQSAAAAAAVQPYDPFHHQPYDPSYYYPNNYHDPSPRPHYDANPYYPNSYQQHQPPSFHDQQQSGLGLGLGRPYGYPLNPTAAVAALSQLTHFMPGPALFDQGHFRPPVGHPPYNGGRRGGGSFRGGGQGNPSFRSPNTGASGPPFRGRGHGRGRGRGRAGRRGPPSSNPESSAQPPARTAWCEVCKIDCTTDEVLNVHNNGRRHKKNLQKLQRMKSASAGAVAHPSVVQTEKDEKPASDIVPEVQENVPETETEPDKTDKPTEAGDDNEKPETEKNEVDNQEKKDRMPRKMKRGVRGMRGGRGGAKRMRVAGPRIRKVVIPLVCDLCNTKCDTQEVFDRHVAGKKHRSKVKRFEGHQAMYGPTAVQALYPPNPLSQTLGPQPQAAYNGSASSSYPVPPPPEAYVPAPPYQVQNPNPQLADAPLEFSTQNAVLTG